MQGERLTELLTCINNNKRASQPSEKDALFCSCLSYTVRDID